MADGGLGKQQQGIRLGDPAPWFSAVTLGGGRVDLHVDAGRWVVLVFSGSLANDASRRTLDLILAAKALFSEEHMVCYVLLADRLAPADMVTLNALAGSSINFLEDYDGAIGRQYGADKQPRSIVLDSMLRAIADIAQDHPGGHDSVLWSLLEGLPPVEHSAGTRLTAPVLIIPRVFDFPLCDFLVELFNEDGGTDSGFLLDSGGTTHTVVNHALKRRRDYVIGAQELQSIIHDRVVTRVLPAITRYFGFSATRMDRTMVSRYGAEESGHFFRHRDNVNAGAAHRRFAMTIGLNKDFEGGGLRFPEFGPATYTAPVGGAVVFSCGMLHEVLPVTSGSRYVFVPFLYGEEDAALRLSNNRYLADGEAAYHGDADRLFPKDI